MIPSSSLVVLGLVLFATGRVQGQSADLLVELVGNAGVILSDGTTSVLVDLPYQSGAFGYESYRPNAMQPAGDVVSAITHHHADHFDPTLFLERPDWRIIGPPSVVDRLPRDRVIRGDSLTVGHFTVVILPTAHTDDHRSYRIRWRGRVFYFVGDTEDPASVPVAPRPDILFVTPWLACFLVDAARDGFGSRSILYHRRPDGNDRVCGPVERLEQGTRFRVAARPAN